MPLTESSVAGTASDLTVVIPTLGRPLLEQCLDALARGTVRPAGVIVVHQGTNDDTRRLCERTDAAAFPCRYVRREAERGLSAGRNRGVARVRTRFFAIIDDDCIAESDWIERLREALHGHPEAVVTGQVRAGGEGFVPSVIESPEPRVHREPLLRRDVLFAGCMGCAVAVYDRVGPFSEVGSLRPSAEDNEWAYRVLRAGFEIHYEPRVKVTHLDWRTPEEAEDVERRYALGQGGFYGLYLRRGDRFIARRAVRDVLRAGKMGVDGARRRDTARRRLGALRLRGLFRGLLRGLTERGPLVPPPGPS